MTHADKHIATKALLVTLTVAGIGTFAPQAYAAQGLACGGNLDFGTLTVGAGGGNVTIRPATQDRVTAGNVTIINAAALIVPNCSFTGDPFASVQVSVPAATAVVNNGANTMVINNFNLAVAGGSNSGGPVTTVTGSAVTDVRVGARLNLNAGQVAGTYTGTFTVMATFQ